MSLQFCCVLNSGSTAGVSFDDARAHIDSDSFAFSVPAPKKQCLQVFVAACNSEELKRLQLGRVAGSLGNLKAPAIPTFSHDLMAGPPRMADAEHEAWSKYTKALSSIFGHATPLTC